MLRFIRDPLFMAWALLVAVTLVSSRIGGPHWAGWIGSTAAVTVAVLSIAYAKVAVVMFAFMEVRGAPLALRVLCTVWLVVVLSGLLAVHFRAIP